MSKALYLSVISGRFIRYEDIPVTSHAPQLLASNWFLSEKRDPKVGCECLNLKFHRLISMTRFILNMNLVWTGNDER